MEQRRARGMLAAAAVIFGTLAPFVRGISVSSGELALYRAVMAALLVGEALRLFGREAFRLFLLLDGLDALRHVALRGAGEHGVFARDVGRRGEGGGSGRIVPGSLAGDGKAERGGFGSPGARRRDAEADASGNDQRGASHGHHARRDARSLLGVSFHCQASNTFRQATHGQTAGAVTAWLIVRGFAAGGPICRCYKASFYRK